jgi:hypothetical protein
LRKLRQAGIKSVGALIGRYAFKSAAGIARQTLDAVMLLLEKHWT